jgi:hypothetical protein
MYQKTLTPKSKEITIRIPDEYVNHKIEIIIKPYYENIKKTAGIIKDKIDPLKWQKELRDEWQL